MGNVLARSSVTMTTGASIACGRAIALTGAVTMDSNLISNDCGVNGGDFGSGGFGGQSIVPEPSTLALLGPCGLALAVCVRRRQRSHVA